MRMFALSITALSFIGLSASVVGAAPSVSGISGCILNNGAKAGSVSYNPAKSGGGSGSGGNSGGGRDSAASVSSNFPNCSAGNNGTWNQVNTVNAQEVNNAFAQMEQQTQNAIFNAVQNSTHAIRQEYNNAIAQNKQKIEIKSNNPEIIKGPDDGVFFSRTTGYVGVSTSSAPSKSSSESGTDLTSMSAGSGFR